MAWDLRQLKDAPKGEPLPEETLYLSGDKAFFNCPFCREHRWLDLTKHGLRPMPGGKVWVQGSFGGGQNCTAHFSVLEDHNVYDTPPQHPCLPDKE